MGMAFRCHVRIPLTLPPRPRPKLPTLPPHLCTSRFVDPRLRGFRRYPLLCLYQPSVSLILPPYPAYCVGNRQLPTPATLRSRPFLCSPLSSRPGHHLASDVPYPPSPTPTSTHPLPVRLPRPFHPVRRPHRPLLVGPRLPGGPFTDAHIPPHNPAGPCIPGLSYTVLPRCHILVGTSPPS